jgi:hypothetical protein
MLFTVHFEDGGHIVLMGTFLMRSDADLFVAHSAISESLIVTEVEKWEAWKMIRGEIKLVDKKNKVE